MLSSIATIFCMIAMAISTASVAWLLVEEILWTRKEGTPTPSDWFIVRDREGSYIGGEFVEVKEGQR